MANQSFIRGDDTQIKVQVIFKVEEEIILTLELMEIIVAIEVEVDLIGQALYLASLSVNYVANMVISLI
ncbi:conserved hypothetical protein, partial [Ricinus communis]